MHRLLTLVCLLKWVLSSRFSPLPTTSPTPSTPPSDNCPKIVTDNAVWELLIGQTAIRVFRRPAALPILTSLVTSLTVW